MGAATFVVGTDMNAEARSNKITRNAVRVWMRQVMEEKKWSALEWANQAKTSATNITRVLSPVSDIIPSAGTIAKLARVAGSQPNLGAYERVAARSVRLIGFGQWNVMDQFSGGSILAPTEVSSSAFAVRIDNTMMNLGGIMSGDVVVVEPGAAVEDNNVIIGDGPKGPLIGRVTGAWVMFNSLDTREPVLLKNVKIAGRCISVMRTL